jgi:sugar lactone lactonase YvrE
MSISKYLMALLISGFLLGQGLIAQEINFSLVREYESNFNFPTDLCGNAKGDVFVLDGMNDRVVVLKANGEVSDIKPQRESFYKAVGIAWIKGELWIADTPRSRLIKMELDGRISQVIALAHGIEPVDLIAAGDYKVVSDRMNHTITVLDENAEEKYFWGSRGESFGQFINPGFMAMAPENRLIIGDILNRRVVSYSQSGRYPQVIAKPGVERGQIFRPKGIDIDAQGRIWVADGYTGAIQAFSVSGKFVGIASSKGKSIALKAPMGIWVDKQNRLWVVEALASKVSVWQISK